MNTLNLAMELSNKTWKLGFGIHGRNKIKVINVPAGDWEAFEKAVGTACCYFRLENPSIRSCYKAGRDGFWIHRGLSARGVKNEVMDSSSIKVDRRKRKAKTDGLDVRSLLGLVKRAHQENGEQEHRTCKSYQPETLTCFQIFTR